MAFVQIEELARKVAGGGVEVDFDLTILGQIGLFLVLFISLKPLLFDPMLKLFEERERKIEGSRKKARQIDDQSAGALAEYEAAMTRARAEGNAQRERLRGEGVAQETALLSMVRLETMRQTEDGKQAALAELAKVRGTLKLQVPEMARDLAKRVLGREVA
jgi:F-type H+-transporting ATPase subunit b